ncbi:hypothetical protein DWB84_15305 [Saccharophagus sp. K07]|uniref:hypothetical protein n=1 Tax=Saccharophagus sp. K07 TaxID=2283636 RepID=UPI0016526A37|nr:hypothetical protein [Saccharophagus sp. K07]MBC6906815.1 hypothetical protein [Saccharophagus sp. K07]
MNNTAHPAREAVAMHMTDLAAEFHLSNKEVDGVDDIEFWIHKLFNKICGYMTKNGFGDLWDEEFKNRC